METLLDKEKISRNGDRVTFDIMYCPVFEDRDILEVLHILFASHE